MWLQNIRFGPSNVITSESNSSNEENNRYDTDSERGATTQARAVLATERDKKGTKFGDPIGGQKWDRDKNGIETKIFCFFFLG